MAQSYVKIFWSYGNIAGVNSLQKPTVPGLGEVFFL